MYGVEGPMEGAALLAPDAGPHSHDIGGRDAMPILLAAAALAQATPVPPPTAPAAPAPVDVARMAALYDEACLQTFPIDGQLDALMMKKGATPMPADQVRISLKEDPGRGWRVRDGDQTFVVLLELPPYHACSVRASQNSTGSSVDLAPYRAVVDRFVATHRDFAAQPPMDMTRGGIRIHGEMQSRPLPNGAENLLVINQQIVDPKLLEPGTTSTPLRFVHQIVTKS